MSRAIDKSPEVRTRCRVATPDEKGPPGLADDSLPSAQAPERDPFAAPPEPIAALQLEATGPKRPAPPPAEDPPPSPTPIALDPAARVAPENPRHAEAARVGAPLRAAPAARTLRDRPTLRIALGLALGLALG